jgi:Cytidylate kinase-like family
VACRVVCISHAAGAGGEEVGRLVAGRLGFLYVDDEIVAQAAARGGIGPAEVADEEKRRSLVARVLDALAQGGGEAWALGAVGTARAGQELTSDDLRALIKEAVEQTAARGKVVIVAHAASHAVARGPETLRVLVTASPSTRASRLGDDGARKVKDEDAARRDYLRRFYDVDEETATHYDLVINTDVLSVEQAADVVAHAGAT